MTARDLMASTEARIVEQFNNSRKQGCIVRWDFKPVMNQVPTSPKRRGCHSPKNRENEEQQFEERDSGYVSFSHKSYPSIPSIELVLADIDADLSLRYSEDDKPVVDVEKYKTALESLANTSV